MEPYDLFADKMAVTRPVLSVFFSIIRSSERCYVIGQRVDPYVHDMLWIVRNRDAPVEGSTRDTQILHALLNERNHFVASRLRNKEIRICSEELKQSVCILAHSEEISFFACLFYRSSAVRAASVDQLGLCPEGLAFFAVKALIGSLVYIAVIIHSLPDLLHTLHMSRLCGPDEIIIGYLHCLPQILDAGYDLVNILLRGHALLLCEKLDLLSVLVCTCQEHDIVTLQSLESRHRVSHDCTVCVSDMQIRARIVNWS